ncbi:MAG: isoprenylcysteine carboxylmethyltransferase family protein [Candidatus Saccharimonadales bacterium]
MHLLALLSFPGYILVYGVLLLATGRPRPKKDLCSGRLTSDPPAVCMAQILSMILWIIGMMTLKNKPTDDWVLIRFLGLAFIVSGLCLSVCAKVALGRRGWVGGIGIYKNHKLVTTGPYRYIRHPMYFGMLVSGIGIGMTAFSVWYLLAGVVLGVGFMSRIGGEEGILYSRIVSYRGYMTKTGRLLPRIRQGSPPATRS